MVRSLLNSPLRRSSKRPVALPDAAKDAVVSKASGMAEKEISAPRQSRSVIKSSATTSTAPIAKEFRSFSMALSMKLAGRSSAGW